MLYRAVTKIYAQGQLQDTYVTPFGIRSIEYVADKGFFLNGQHRKFQGVCLHHDLGPLGAAVNESAIRHQLRLLKEMVAMPSAPPTTCLPPNWSVFVTKWDSC